MQNPAQALPYAGGANTTHNSSGNSGSLCFCCTINRSPARTYTTAQSAQCPAGNPASPAAPTKTGAPSRRSTRRAAA